MTTPLDRRTFLASAGAAFMAGIPKPARADLDRSDVLFASAGRHPDGSYGAVLLNQRGEIVSTIALPARGHDVVVSPLSQKAVVFARRPGNFAVAIDTAAQGQPKTFNAPAGRHFYGHGAFSANGRLLFATENDYDAARGVIGIYDATDTFHRIGEFDSFGIGPHEIVLMPDGKTLAVCNGGIETHPDYGRTKLNLNDMRPSLAFIDYRHGSLVERHDLPADLKQLSIRHLAVGPNGQVVFGGQYEGPETHRPPLFGKARIGHDLTFFSSAKRQLDMFRNYIGSVALSRSGEQAALSSPRGNTIAILSVKTGAVLQEWSLGDGCGVAFHNEDLFASSGEGAFGRAGAPTHHAIRFDNHLATLSA